MKLFLFSLVLILVVGGCKKGDEPGNLSEQALLPTHWRIGNDSFSTKSVFVSVDRLGTVTLYGFADAENDFWLAFPGGLLRSGCFPVGYNNPNFTGEFIAVAFMYKSVHYLLKTSHGTLACGAEEGGLARILLPDTWAFKDSLTSNDSVLVSGTFYEPYQSGY